jgi:Ca2+-binding RTX toxin-like protein
VNVIENLFVGTNTADLIIGTDGRDVVHGEAGDDYILVEDDGANDIYSGDASFDTLDYSTAAQPVTIDIARGFSTTGTGHDQFDGFEHFIGSDHADTFHAGSGAAQITTGVGADVIQFARGDFVNVAGSQYRINDFEFDDMIAILSGDQHNNIRKAKRSLEDRIEDFFEDVTQDLGADEPRLRFSHEWSEDMRLTVIEVDFDRDRNVDLRVELTGNFQLVAEYY